MQQQNWDFLDVSVRDAARDVLNHALTFEQAATKYSVPVEYVEAKVTDPQYHPPRQQRKTSTIVDALRRSPTVQPRDVLNAEDKVTKAVVIKDTEHILKEKRSIHPKRVQCIIEAANEVNAKVLTPRAAAEKYNVSIEDVQGQVKNRFYASELVAPLGPKQRAKHKLLASVKNIVQARLPEVSSVGRDLPEREIEF